MIKSLNTLETTQFFYRKAVLVFFLVFVRFKFFDLISIHSRGRGEVNLSLGGGTDFGASVSVPETLVLGSDAKMTEFTNMMHG